MSDEFFGAASPEDVDSALIMLSQAQQQITGGGGYETPGYKTESRRVNKLITQLQYKKTNPNYVPMTVEQLRDGILADGIDQSDDY